MAIKIAYTMSDEDYQLLKKQYEKNKAKLGNVTFEEFLNHSIDIAIKGHIQFSMMNEQMVDLFSDFGLNSFGELGKAAKNNMNKFDDIVNKFFQENMKGNKKQTNDTSNNNEDDNNKSNEKKLN